LENGKVTRDKSGEYGRHSSTRVCILPKKRLTESAAKSPSPAKDLFFFSEECAAANYLKLEDGSLALLFVLGILIRNG
jgi:hypothetical protein